MKLDKWSVGLILGLVLIGAVVLIGNKNKWFSPKNKLKLKDGEGDVNTDENGNVEVTEYTRSASYVHNQIHGTNWNVGIFSAPLWTSVGSRLYPYTKNELRIVSNEYERLFPDDGTLGELIENEWTGCGSTNEFSISDHPDCFKFLTVRDRLREIKS